jgi:hypothetical protein
MRDYAITAINKYWAMKFISSSTAQYSKTAETLYSILKHISDVLDTFHQPPMSTLTDAQKISVLCGETPKSLPLKLRHRWHHLLLTPLLTFYKDPSSHQHKHITNSDSHHLPPPKRRAEEIGDCRIFQFTLFPPGMMRSSTPSRGYSNVTVGGGPVGVPLPIGGTSAILGLSMTGPYPHSLVKRRGGGEEEVTRVTARSRLSIVAGGRRQRILKIGACGAAGGPCGEAGDCQWFFGKAVPKGSPVIGRHTATATSGCVYYCSTYYKAVRVGGGGEQWRTCATRDYEPRPVWTSLPITH